MMNTIMDTIKSINWTVVTAIVTAIGLLYTWLKNFRDNRYKRSQFYLEQIKDYLSRAVVLLSEGGNNNIKWHQAIECLKTADSLMDKLTDKSHQRICFADYFYTAYCIIDIVGKIDDFRFFYGILEYRNRDSKELYSESNPKDLKEKCLRIAPEALRTLCAYVCTNQDFKDMGGWGSLNYGTVTASSCFIFSPQLFAFAINSFSSSVVSLRFFNNCFPATQTSVT